MPTNEAPKWADASSDAERQATAANMDRTVRDAHRLIALDGGTKTLSSGELTVDFTALNGVGKVTVNPESGVADDLTGINTGSEADDNGAILYVEIATGDTITAKDSGNLTLDGDFSLDSEYLLYAFYCNGTEWKLAGGAGGVKKGVSLYILRMNAAGDDYSFVNPQTVKGIVTPVKHFNNTGHSYASSTERTMPNSTKNITVPALSTVIVIGMLTVRAAAVGNHTVDFKGNIDGGNVDGTFQRGYQSTWDTIGFHFSKENVAAGSVDVLLRESEQYSSTYNVDLISYTVFIIPE